MTERDDLRESRERNLRRLEDLGLPYLPNRYGPIRHSAEVKEAYDSLQGSTVRVAGRLMRVRVMGKAAFAHIQDAAGEIQLYFKRDVIGETRFDYFKLLDLGDIIGAEGEVFTTRTGEITVQVNDLVLLAKALAPLPEKYHGLTDVERRYRQRYLDLITNEEARRIFRLRSAVISGLRRFLDSRGFTEVETPTLQPLYGGGAATPFLTHYEELDQDVYLRIATELYLKRLIVGGMERVYEIGKDFRNEGFSRKHSPEFTMLELYQAYVDYHDIMALTEEMFSGVAQQALGTHRAAFGDAEIDLGPPWRRISIQEALRELGEVDLDLDAGREKVVETARSRGLHVDPEVTRGKLIEELVGELVEPHLIQPTILYDFPVDFPGSLLVKRKRDQPYLVERFEVYIGGMEIANAFTELNEPEDQLARMREAARLRGEEHAEMDWDFIRALQHGMPPTGGLGVGVDRLIMVLTGAGHIRETILFPLLRPEDPHA